MFRPSASRHPFFWGTVIALCAAFGGQSLASVPAAAAAPSPVSGYTYVERTSALNSVSTRSVSAPCPRGKVVLAGGASIVGGKQRVLLRGSYPADPVFGQKWTAWAQELGTGTSNRWRVRAYAICANKPAGLTVVHSNKAFSSSSSQFAVRSCPTGTKLIGLGANLIGADSRVGLNSIGITPGMNAFARAGEALSTTQQWTVVSYALCAQPLGQAFRQTGRWVSPDPFSSVTVNKNCPQGTRVFGTGLLLNGSGTTLNQLIPVALHPTPDLASRRGLATVSERPGTLGPWSIKAQVLCAR